MKTTTSTAMLDRAGAALTDAHAAMSSGASDDVVHDALIALSRASHDALQQWEATRTPAPTSAPAIWHSSLEELRVQVALAEMELRDAGGSRALAADDLVRTVSSRLAAARHEVGEALVSLRTELHKVIG